MHDVSGAPPAGSAHGGGHDHGGMLADYWRRVPVSLVLTIPILVPTLEVQELAGVETRSGRLSRRVAAGPDTAPPDRGPPSPFR